MAATMGKGTSRRSRTTQRSNFMTIPTEIQLEIVRYAIIADPPRLDHFGELSHPLLLNTSDFHIHSLVEDLIFHASAIIIPYVSEYWPPSEAIDELDLFLEYHDRIHGKAKRHLIHLTVVDRPTQERNEEESVLFYMDMEWIDVAQAVGLHIEIENQGRY